MDQKRYWRPPRDNAIKRLREKLGADDFDAANPKSEATYWRSLVDSSATVTVVLNTGERLRGRVRYYDRSCVSLGLAPHGPNVFLRKERVLYLSEE